MSKYKAHWKDWATYTMRIPPSLKTILRKEALERDVAQAVVIRESLEEHFSRNAESEDVKKAMEVINQRRKETLRLETPKNTFDSLLFPTRVKKFVRTMMKEYTSLDWDITPAFLDRMISFVQSEKEVVKGNPEEDFINERLDELLSELETQKARLTESVS